MGYDAEDIAIVGMAGLYPEAENIDVFWENILAGKDCVTDAPDGWLGVGDIFDPESDIPMKLYTQRGGFLGDLARFDPIKHQTMPRSLATAQPDQFLALKLAFDALVDAGCTPGKFDGSRTGVILGHSLHFHRGNVNGIQHVWMNDQVVDVIRSIFPKLEGDRLDAIRAMLDAKGDPINAEGIPGLVPNIMTGRICNRLDLMGTNYVIDAACSSSIISVDHAITELRTGRADMMLAGGVNTTTSPPVYSVFSIVEALSQTGRIRPFSREANGTVLGEGAGIVVLKRLSDAIRDDNRIHAVIKGIGQSSDGKSSGLMAPRLEGEVAAMQRAYENTGLDPATIGLLEAHGTGIPLGDQTEVKALRTVFGERRGPLPTIPVGSVKSMIGHCIPASGSAAIIKLSMALQNKIVPPTLCDEVSEELGLQDTPFYVSTEARPWTHSADHPRRAAVNAFGFGGINAHIILEEAPGNDFIDPTAAFSTHTVLAKGREQVVPFAAATRDALLDQIRGFATALNSNASFDVLCADAWTTATDTAGPMRLAVVAQDAADYLKKIDSVLDKLQSEKTKTLQTRSGVYFEAQPIKGKVAFLFPGEMAQYEGMMQDVALCYPAVRDWFDFIGRLTETKRAVRTREVVFPPMNLVDAETRDMVHDLMHQVDYGSEIVFAADQAVFTLLSSLGLKADSMLGHSTGENAAIVASGIIDWSRDDVGEMIASMNEIFAEVQASGAVPNGVLLTIAALDQAELLPMIEGDDDIHFTMDNCPNQSIVFGPKDKLDALEKDVVAKGALCTRLPISWGYHTEFVRPMANQFGKLFEKTKFTATPDATLYSCATAQPFPNTKKARIETAVSQYVSRVRFREGVQNLYDDGHRIFIECGPSSNLTAFVGDTLGRGKDYIAIAADNPRKGMGTQLRHVVARLFAAGQPVQAANFLNPPVTEDQARRRAEGDAYLKAPVLQTNLQTLTFDDTEAQQIRAMVTEVLPRPMAPGTGHPAPAVHRPQADYAMHQHLELMRDFVTAQGNVASHAVQNPALAQAPVAAPVTRHQIRTVNLAQTVSVPFDFSAYLLTGAPSFAAVSPYLGADEQVQARSLLESAKSSRAWSEWSLSRLAVKLAASDIMTRAGLEKPQSPELEVRKNTDGAPYLYAPVANGHTPAISISHVDNRGVGAAADPRWRVGVDFELPARLQDPAGFLETILSDEERNNIGVSATPQGAAALWSAKEAAAKALGVGIQGRPQAFTITQLESGTGKLQVFHNGQMLDVCVTTIGDGVFAVAYLSAVQ